MNDSPPDAPRGLRLPPDVIQPFLLHFRPDDLHVMAFFDGHPEYEAVEAMIQNRDSGGYSIRAILTRHDQSQIDHINDESLFAKMRGAQREICQRPIDLQLESMDGARRARLAFSSYRGEQVALDVITAGLPDPKGGGLTDPGGHSATSSLPLMWRGASVLAGPLSRVTIDGMSYDVPVKVRSGPFVAHEGYYTEHHSMGVIRAGAVALTLLRRPDRLDVGAEWVFEGDGQALSYRVTARADDGRLRIEKRDGSGETMTAYALGDRLEVTQIDLPADTDGSEGLTLAFDGAGGFNISIEGARGQVVGRAEVVEAANEAVVRLAPTHPNWAADRRVRVACSRRGGEMSLVTTIGVSG
jgi:hypothetical protein